MRVLVLGLAQICAVAFASASARAAPGAEPSWVAPTRELVHELDRILLENFVSEPQALALRVKCNMFANRLREHDEFEHSLHNCPDDSLAVEV